MKTMHGPGLAGLLVAVALTVASCGGNAGGGSQEGMQGMDQGGSDGGRSSERASETTGGGMAGMDHGEEVAGEDTARQMLSDEDGDYTDRLFVDMMVPHHQGAVEMAEVALKNAEHEEILELSGGIVRTQEAEIKELKDIKKQEFGTAEVPTGISDDEMRGMGMTTDPRQLAEERPFDRAFIDSMIPHHRSAIDMANVALEESDNPRIRELATNIISAQEREIARMEGWRDEWYPQN